MFNWVETYRSSRTSGGSHFNLNILPQVESQKVWLDPYWDVPETLQMVNGL